MTDDRWEPYVPQQTRHPLAISPKTEVGESGIAFVRLPLPAGCRATDDNSPHVDDIQWGLQFG